MDHALFVPKFDFYNLDLQYESGHGFKSLFDNKELRAAMEAYLETNTSAQGAKLG